MQAHHDAVPENFGEYKRPWEIRCVIVAKVTTKDDDLEINTSFSRVGPFSMEPCII